MPLVGGGKGCYACAGFGARVGGRSGEVAGVLGDETVAQGGPGEKVDGYGVLEGGLGGDGALPLGHGGPVLFV